jgi:hypothetical protein
MALWRNLAHVPESAGSDGYVLEQCRFRIEGFRHGSLSGKYRLAPLRAEFVRVFANVVFQEDFVRRPTLQSDRHGMEPSANLVFSPVNMARKSESLIPEICTPLFATNTTS